MFIDPEASQSVPRAMVTPRVFISVTGAVLP